MRHQHTYTSQPLMFRTLHEQPVAVRPATTADTFLLADMLGRLSERTRYFRYMGSGFFSSEAIWDEAMRMTQGDSPDHTTIVGMIRPKKSDEAVAIAELVRDQQEPTVGEIALVVRDDQQRQGIGSFLLWQLISLAQHNGITRLSASILAENKAMLRLIRSVGLPYTATAHSGEIQMLLQVPRSPRRSPPQRIDNSKPLGDSSTNDTTTPQLAWLMKHGVSF